MRAAIVKARRFSRSLFESPILMTSDSVRVAAEAPLPWRSQIAGFSQLSSSFSGNHLQIGKLSAFMRTLQRANFSSEAASVEEGISKETVKEIHDKIIESVVVKRTMSPNSWLWSLLANCQTHDDIKMLFNVLENLRRFRLSNLRIGSNFNLNLCREVTKTCVRVGALDFAKKTLWKHNVYGITPTIASAHQILLHAKEHNDTKLMVEIMDLLKKNDLPLQPGTADIIFSICYNTDNWELFTKYSKKFVLGGVKLRKSSFNVWTEFATKIGDAESIARIEKLRPKSAKEQAIAN